MKAEGIGILGSAGVLSFIPSPRGLYAVLKCGIEL